MLLLELTLPLEISDSDADDMELLEPELALDSERAGDNQKAIDQLQRAITLYRRFPVAIS